MNKVYIDIIDQELLGHFEVALEKLDEMNLSGLLSDIAWVVDFPASEGPATWKDNIIANYSYETRTIYLRANYPHWALEMPFILLHEIGHCLSDQLGPLEFFTGQYENWYAAYNEIKKINKPEQYGLCDYSLSNVRELFADLIAHVLLDELSLGQLKRIKKVLSQHNIDLEEVIIIIKDYARKQNEAGWTLRVYK